MNHSNEQRQRETDRQGGIWEARRASRERFYVPEPLSPAQTLSNRAAAESSELASEGRAHVNVRPQRHE